MPARALTGARDSSPGVQTPPRAVPEGAAPPPPPSAGCRGGVGHSSEPSDASYKNNNLLAGVRSREEGADRAPKRMLGLVVSTPPYIGQQRREELRLPKSSAACRGETTGSREPHNIRPGRSKGGEAPLKVAMETGYYNR